MKFPLIDKQCIDWAIHFPLDSQIKAKNNSLKSNPHHMQKNPNHNIIYDKSKSNSNSKNQSQPEITQPNHHKIIA